MRASRCAVDSSPLLAQLAMSPAATTTGSPVVCPAFCCVAVCRVASVACSALRRGEACLEVCFGVRCCEPQPTARRMAKARIPTAIGATLLIVPMATIPSRFFSFAFAPCSINGFLNSNSPERRAHSANGCAKPDRATVPRARGCCPQEVGVLGKFGAALKHLRRDRHLLFAPLSVSAATGWVQGRREPSLLSTDRRPSRGRDRRVLRACRQPRSLRGCTRPSRQRTSRFVGGRADRKST